jgi:DNA-binding MarR family transcriptional regulator
MSDALTTSTEPLPVAEANFGYLFRLAHQRFRAALEEALEDLGLSGQEYAVLSVFESRSELSISELARITQVTRQTMHAAVRGLEAAGLLERAAVNRRVVLLNPTRKGRGVLETATARVRAIEQDALAELSRDEEHAVRSWLAGVASR